MIPKRDTIIIKLEDISIMIPKNRYNYYNT